MFSTPHVFRVCVCDVYNWFSDWIHYKKSIHRHQSTKTNDIERNKWNGRQWKRQRGVKWKQTITLALVYVLWIFSRHEPTRAEQSSVEYVSPFHSNRNDKNTNNVKSINIQQYKAAQETTLAPAVCNNDDNNNNNVNKPMKSLSVRISYVCEQRVAWK